ncbi:MAG: YqaA family protein [Bacteroidales bacterium]|nr:YqaA family protein [Bacteroidales bacterium]
MLESLGLLGLFIGSFLASTILPFPSEALLVGNIALGNNVWTCVLLAGLGNSLGGMTSFGLGRLGKIEWIEKLFKVSKEKITRMQKTVNRYKAIAAFFAWLPFVGDVIAITLGWFKISPLKSCLYMTLGRFTRFTVVGVLLQYFDGRFPIF